MVLRVVQVPAASLTVGLDHMVPLVGQPVGSAISKKIVQEPVLSVRQIPTYRMGPLATVTLPTAMMECVRPMMINASFTLVCFVSE